MGRNFFDPVDPKPDFPSKEKELLSGWYKNGIVDKYLSKNKSSSKYFSFLDGPITANNPMGVHHAWGRTYKDLWQRYKNMQGFKERFQNGFDCQGLWVEVEVEKELGLKGKKEIENLVPGDKKASIAKFVELCKERVLKYSAIQTEQSKRLGYFMDWDNSYFTMSEENNYMIWHFLKKCYELGLIYKGHDVVPWCPRCETAISQHEMLTEDYKEITHDSIYFKLLLKNANGNEYLLVWTTTPWTIPGNVAVAVDKDKMYTKYPINGGKEWVWVLSEAIDKLIKEGVLLTDGSVIKDTSIGAMLVGKEYEGAFDDFPRISEKLKGYTHKVIATDNLILPVSIEEGTGLIHIAPGQGSEDYQLGKKESLPVIELIDDTATYLNGLGDFSGRNAKKHPELIVDYLTKEGYLFKTEKYAHRYPACWRCKTELVWKVADEWYIAMDKGKPSLRERMVRVAKRISWIPGFGLERELDWLKNMHDWLISKKNRYWGLALPIWVCSKCKHFTVVGSKEELKEKAVSGWEKFEGHTPHKPWIDEVKIKCEECGETAERILDVGNPWLDAGIVTYSTISKDNKSEPLYLKDKKEWQKWAPADFITESFPGQFKNWFYSLIAMSTVMEDMNPFKVVLGYGTLFGEDGRAMHKSWGNMVEFNEGADKIGVDVMRWMFARQNPAENALFGYKIADEVRRKFHLKLWNVYNFFVTYANLDGWEPGSKENKTSENILDKWILVRLNENIKLVSESLDKFDAYTASDLIDKFVDDLSIWYIRRSRDRVGPAAESEEDKNSFYQTTYFVLVTLSKLLAPFIPFISEMICTNLTKRESVHLDSWPVSKELSETDNKLVEEMLKVREIVEKALAERKEKQIPVRQPLNSFSTTQKPVLKSLEYLIKDEINAKKIVWNSKTNKFDTEITLELEEEAKTRELVRKIQGERKNMGLFLNQKVNVKNNWIPVNKEQLEWLKKKAQIENVSKGDFNVQLV